MARVAAGDRARELAGGVTDPEMPMLTLADLGVLREVVVESDADGETVVVTITPTYSGCPALGAMRDDLVRTLQEDGFERVRVRISLEPAWSTDWITASGRQALTRAGLSAPGPAPRAEGPVPLTLTPRRRDLTCPRCGSGEVEVTSEFGATACKALYCCRSCREPFEHVKEI